MAKAVIIKTPTEIKLMGTFQCSNGAWFDAEGCYRYCNSEKSEFLKEHQTNKLLANATFLGYRTDPTEEKDWYKNRENFIDIELSLDGISQEYKQ